MSFFETKRQFSSNFAALSSVMKDNSAVLFHLKLYRLSTKGTHQRQIFRLSTASMKINQIPCHFSNRESVFTWILLHLPVSWHIIPLKFSSYNVSLWTKRAHQSTNFQIFECRNESSPNSSSKFRNHKVKVYLNFASLFSVTKYNSFLFVAAGLEKLRFTNWNVLLNKNKSL